MMSATGDKNGAGGQWAKVRQQKREYLLEATAKIFAEYGYEKSSMGMLASAANVTKATLYAHFGKKNQLFEAVLIYWLDALSSPIPFAEEREGLRAQLAAVERYLRHPASRAMACALARSVHVPKAYVERWHQSHASLCQYLEDFLSERTGCDKPERAANHFLTLVLINIGCSDAIRPDDSSHTVDIVDLFVRAYGTAGGASNGTTKYQ